MLRYSVFIVSVIVLLTATRSAVASPRHSSPQATPVAETIQRPNIILLMTDDQTVADMRVMPKARSLLADQGVTFSNFLISYPLCCPSRTTYLTGQYAHNHGVLSNRPPLGGYKAFKEQETTFPVALQQAGYRTMHIGKYLNGYGSGGSTEIPPGWNEWHASLGASTYQYYGYTLNDNGTLHTYGNSEADYQTDVYGRLASQLIRAQASSEKPFFLNVAFVAPHTGGGASSDDDTLADLAQAQAAKGGSPDRSDAGMAVPPKRYAGHFAKEPLPKPPSFDEKDVSDKPSFIRRLHPFTQSELDAMARSYHARLESLLAVDDAVQQIVTTLSETTQLERTVILLTSDNGWFYGEHRIPYGKYLPYEESIRVPLIIRGPGFPKGVTRQVLTANVDLAPTILDLAHAEPLRPMDGRSLLPLIKDPDLRWGRDILLEAFTDRHSSLEQPYVGLRTPRFAYWEYGNGERELYDLQTDPYELNNRHDQPAFKTVEAELHRRLTKLSSCAALSCSKGPEIRLRLAYHTGKGKAGQRCARSGITVSIFGRERKEVRRLDLFVGKRHVLKDKRPPFSARIRLQWLRRSQASFIRARVTLKDGRSMTIDRGLRACTG